MRPLASNGTFLTVTAHYSVQIWYTDLERALADACDRIRTTVGRDQWARHLPGLDYARRAHATREAGAAQVTNTLLNAVAASATALGRAPSAGR
ncbi:hypothetical protein ABZ759_19820 [Streptomyces sp. NPDC047860]|uniref:hypothetical protein n=1 Tax=Streptomyces sp. NPDC047860 TaxID=3155743 RepID=UPI003402EDE4